MTWAVLVAALALLVYSPTINYALLWDDPMILEFIKERLSGKGLTALVWSDFRVQSNEPLGFYRPVILYSFVLDSLVSRFLPQIFHLTNILVHAANTVLVFWAARLLFSSVGPAAAAAALFAAHPVHIESVAFVSGRSDLWATFFVLLATLPWLGARRGLSIAPAAGVLASGLAYGLGALCKESALLLPAVLLIWEVLDRPNGSSLPRERLKSAAPWFLGWCFAAATVLWLRLGVAGVGFGVGGGLQPPASPADLPAVAAKLAMYCTLLWFPWPLVPYYYFPEGLALRPWTVAAAAAVGLLATLQASPSRGRVGLLGLSWLLLFLLPVSGIIPIQGPLIAQRYLYLPSIGFCLVAGYALWGVLNATGFMRAALPAAIAALVVLSLLTMRSMAFWRDDLSFARQFAQHAPAFPESYVKLGNALGRSGARLEAMTVYQDALGAWPYNRSLLYNQGVTLMGLGRHAEAERVFRRITEIASHDAMAWNNLGVALSQLGRSREAVAAFERALREDPRSQTARTNLSKLR